MSTEKLHSQLMDDAVALRGTMSATGRPSANQFDAIAARICQAVSQVRELQAELGEARYGDTFPKLRDEIKRVTAERDGLQHEVDGLHGICDEQRDELWQAQNSYLHQGPALHGMTAARDGLRVSFDAMQRDRDRLQQQLTTAKRLVGTEQTRIHTHLDAAREERDTLHSQLGCAQRDLKQARQSRPTYRKMALRMKRERDALIGEVDRLLNEDEREQLTFCKQHRDLLQEQVGLVTGHRDALQFDVDMLEAQVRSQDSAIACLEGQVKHFAIAVRAVIHGSVT